MKDTAIRKALGRGAFRLTVVLLMAALSAHAQIIPASRTINWTPGVTVGLQGGTVPARTNIIDATQPPYNADKTGATDASAAIQAALMAVPNNGVVYLPDGTYTMSNGIGFKNNTTLRGNTNTILIGVTSQLGLLYLGPQKPSPSQCTSYTIIGGATKGSTSITLNTTPTWPFGWGQQIEITENTTTMGSSGFPVIDVHQGDNAIQQVCLVGAAVNGPTITLSAPLVFDFTNSPVAIDSGVVSLTGVGLENLIISDTNTVTGQAGAYSFLVQMSLCNNCWMTNCKVLYANNYGLYMTSCSHMWVAHNSFQYALSAGSNHGGLLADADGECLIEDNIFSDGLQPGIEFNKGFCGNAAFGNFFMNNIIDIDCHNTHPMMNLWEQNILSGYFEMDGYFGSASHQTLFRNAIESSYIPLFLKRWISYMNVVGNVLGLPGAGYKQFTSAAINPVGSMIIAFGYPNIGNNTYNGTTSPPLAWNYPGTNYGDAYGTVRPNGFPITNTQVNTGNITGNFAGVPPPIGGVYTLIFQDNINTNLYYPTNAGAVTALAAGTSSGLLITPNFTVSNGWTMFVSGQCPYQQLQLGGQATDQITGNYDCFNNSVTWDSNGAQPLPNSLLYPGGPPSYWGTNRWPAIDPLGTPLIATTPSQLRYSGVAPSTGSTALPWPPGLKVAPQPSSP